jgi:hypothetical protein
LHTKFVLERLGQLKSVFATWQTQGILRKRSTLAKRK